jgi:PKD repeat protein
VVQGAVQASPILDPSTNSLGQSTVVEADHFWFTSPDNQNVAGLAGRQSYSISQLDAVVQELGLGGFIQDWERVADQRNYESVINKPPVASFDFATVETIGDSAAGFLFYANSSNDPGGEIVRYDWNFGDGTVAEGMIVTHSYSSAGQYLLTLTVTDDRGASATTTQTMVAVPNQPPVANFEAQINGVPLTTLTVTVNQVISFDGLSSQDPDGDIISYVWDFGDGTSLGEGSTVEHSYSEAGPYIITLTVTDDRGASSTKSQQIEIRLPPAPGPN